MKFSEALIGLVAVLSLVFSIVAINVNRDNLGGVTNYDSITLGEDLVVGDDTTLAKDLILTDNDFCIDFFATSTATQIKMVASTTIASGSNVGVMTMQYGSCVE